MKKILSGIVYAVSLILGCITVYATLNFALGEDLFDAILFIGDEKPKAVVEEIEEDEIIEEDIELEKEEIEKIQQKEEKEIQEQIEASYIDYKEDGNVFELPVIGATGYSIITTQLLMEIETEESRIEREEKEKAEATAKAREEEGLEPLSEVETIIDLEIQTTEVIELPSEEVGAVEPIDIVIGEPFTIMAEQGDWWLVCKGDVFGWIEHKNCMINLPDVLPSIIYDNTNSYASVYRSLGYDLPGITNEVLYNAKGYNKRLDENTYAIPIMYGTAKKIAEVQANALEDKSTLIIIETYRPNDVQQMIAGGLTQLMKDNAEVNTSISEWGMGWFIATGVSSHQRGIAVDASLAKVKDTEIRYTGDYKYTKVTEYEEHKMPTPIHDLSPESASKSKPVKYTSGNWSKTGNGANMTESATALQRYFINAGMTPIPSEWWHFDDYATYVDPSNVGQYKISNVESVPPTVEPSDDGEEQVILSELVDLASNYMIDD